MIFWLILLLILFSGNTTIDHAVAASEQVVTSQARARFLPAWTDPECADDMLVIDSWTGQLYHIRPAGGHCVNDNVDNYVSEGTEWQVISKPIATPEDCIVDCSSSKW